MIHRCGSGTSLCAAAGADDRRSDGADEDEGQTIIRRRKDEYFSVCHTYIRVVTLSVDG